MLTDPIADMLTSVRNAVKAGHLKVDLTPSNMKLSILDIMQKSGFIKDFKMYRQKNQGIIRVYLRYVDKNRSVIQGIKRISKPSRRVYVSAEEIPKVLGGMGVAIVSTPKGILTDEAARQQKVGGELVCSIW